MYANILAKIEGYRGKYAAILTDDYREFIHTFCQAFIEAFDKIEQNRATSRTATEWFNDLVRSKQENTPAPVPPTFQQITLPAETMVGIEQACREFRRLLVSQRNYNKADGLDLMLEREAADELNLAEVSPVLKYTVLTNDSIDFDWKKTGFDMLELQYRKEGAALWQYADKSTEKIINFTPPLTTPGVPEKFEFRAIYLIKNQRVGQWSQIYVITVG